MSLRSSATIPQLEPPRDRQNDGSPRYRTWELSGQESEAHRDPKSSEGVEVSCGLGQNVLSAQSQPPLQIRPVHAGPDRSEGDHASHSPDLMIESDRSPHKPYPPAIPKSPHHYRQHVEQSSAPDD